MTIEILVPLDGSPRAEHALTPMAQLAAVLDAPITLLMTSIDDGADSRAEYLDDVIERFHLQGANKAVPTGTPAERITAYTAEHPGTMVWLATHARSGAALLALGGVAEQVVTATTEPVLLVGPHVDEDWSPSGGGPVVLAYDASPGADEVTADAETWAARLGTSIHVVTVFHHDGTYIGDHVAPPARAAAHELVARIEREGGRVALDFLDGLNPATEVPRFASSVGASLIVASAHTHTGVVHAALGSVAIRMARHATCPVLVRRAHDLHPTGAGA